MSKSDQIFVEVGSVVLAPYKIGEKGKKTLTGHKRAIVATIDDEDQTVSILWDNLKVKENQSNFIVCPKNLICESNREGLDDIPVKDLLEVDNDVDLDDLSVDDLKAQGDNFLGNIGDYESSIVFYEKILEKVSKIEIGSTCVVRDGSGNVELVEIDCIEDESLDVMYVNRPDVEETLPRNRVLLAVAFKIETRLLQIKVLLNLARCLMGLTKIRFHDGGGSLENLQACRRAAVKSCTLALSCLSHSEEENVSSDNLSMKALYLRSRAFLESEKFKHAYNDLRQILARGTNEDQAKARRLIEDLKRREMQKQRRDKVLTRKICFWVDGAVKQSHTGQEQRNVSTSKGKKIQKRLQDKGSHQREINALFNNRVIVFVVPILIAAFFMFIMSHVR